MDNVQGQWEVQIERIAALRPVFLDLVGLGVVASIVGNLAPAHWQAIELILLVAGIALAWEKLREEGVQASGSHPWVPDSPADLREIRLQNYRPWDVEQAISRLRPAASRFTPAPALILAPRSMEQLTQDVLTQAFGQLSLNHDSNPR